MANFKDSPLFQIHNDYYTPKSAWSDISNIIKRKGHKNIFEAFMLNSNEQSKKYLEELDFNVLGNKNIDFLNEETYTTDIKNKNYDLIVSNPPFEKIKSFSKRNDSLKYKCIEKLIRNDKPFIIILNSTNIHSKWFQFLVKDIQQNIQFIYPTKKINYDKYEKGGINKIYTKSEYLKKINKKLKELTTEEKGIYNKSLNKNVASFNSIYVCYKVIENNMWI